MRKIIISEFLTLDGVMEDPGGAETFQFGGWSMPYFDEGSGQFAFDTLFECDALLLGRVTYEGFAAAWPGRDDPQGFAAKMNSMPKYVATNTLKELEWNNSHVLRASVPDAVRQLKEMEGGNILVYGSAELVQSLMLADLIDEFRLWIHPLMLGVGKRLFPDMAHRTGLKLVSHRTFSTGVMVLTYHRAA